MSINSKFGLPFKIKFKTPVTGGYVNELHEKFYPQTDITNYHRDAVSNDNETNVYTAVLQSPFTERWVGGWQHRHVEYNTGSDTAETRQESWHLEFEPENVKVYSNQHLNSPPAYWTRDGRTKRPVNIKNIDFDGRTYGNYRENYEFLQTSGRRISNNLIVDGLEANGVLTTQFVTGSSGYDLPELNKLSGSRSVIVDRFSAPGSKEENSRGALDREGEEMSPNTPLPFRNIKTRQPFYYKLAQHTPQFGSGSTYALLPDSGITEDVSIHKVHRNTLPGNNDINDSHDNGFIVHSIPRTDIQYNWITASAITTAAELRGYQSYITSTYKRRPGFDDITFVSASLVTSGSDEQYEIDNYSLNSVSKDTKIVDIDTKTFSMSASLSSSFAEVANSRYYFPIWQSLRISETPVARLLRKENIYSLLDPPRTVSLRNGTVEQRRAETSTNYYEPSVTFKYKPLQYGLKINNSNFIMNLDYTNTLSTFANKDLIERKKLSSEYSENTNKIYDYIKKQYLDPNSQISYNAHHYDEIVWPKEERTGLSQTRKREAYYLDKPGFDRDGYDRQLGTQRVFWRDNQEDRKRSNNSDGGYYSSMGYLSSEESGSSFYVEGTTTLIDDSEYIYRSNFSQTDVINSGIYNSISFMESNSAEQLLYTSSYEVVSASADPLVYLDLQINASYKRAYRNEVLGESNSAFVDFYGLSRISGSQVYRDFGSVYRNTFYKSQITTKQYNFSSIRNLYDNISLIQTEDDQIKINPKLRYTSFLGGGELNIGNYVQENFSENENVYLFQFSEFSSTSSKILKNNYADSVSEVSLFGRNNYFDKYGDIMLKSYPEVYNMENVASGTLEIYKRLDDTFELLQTITSSENSGYFAAEICCTDNGKDIIISNYSFQNDNTDCILIYNSSSAGWQQTQKIPRTNMPSRFLGSQMAVSGNLLAIQDLNYNGTGSVYIYESGSSGWQEVQFITSPEEVNFDAAYFGSSIVFGTEKKELFISSPSKRKVYIYNSSSINGWQKQDEIYKSTASSNFGVSCDINEDGNLLLIGEPTYEDTQTSQGISYLYHSNSSGWALRQELLGHPVDTNFLGGSVKFSNNSKFIIVAGRKTAFIYQSGSDSYYNIQEIPTNGRNVSCYVDQDGELLLNVLYKSTPLGTPDQNALFSTVTFYPQEQINLIPKNLFDQTFSEDDILFSTLDNGLQRTTEIDSGKKPFFDSYEEYLQEIYPLTKDHSQIPEFRISENLPDYISSGSFYTYKTPRLSIDGVDENDYRLFANNSLQTNFLKQYSTSDILKKHEKVYQDNRDISELDTINIKVSGIKKLLPYNGFYPQDRITQIANEYDKFVDNNLAGGILNISYEDASRQLEITNHREADISLTENYHIDSIKYNDQYFVAVSYPYHNNNTGLVKLFSSSAEPSLEQNWTQSSFLQLSGEVANSFFGQDIKFVSSSNGVDLFISARGGQGQIWIKSSTDGLDWSSPIKKPSNLIGNYGSYGYSIDAIHDGASYILCVGEPYGPTLNIATSGDGITWTTNNIAVGSYAEYFGIGESVSILLDGVDLYVYASAPQNQYELASSNQIWGQIHRFKSKGANYADWTEHQGYSSTKIITTTFAEGVGIGQNNIEAVKYNGIHYVFYDIVDGFGSGTGGKKILVSYSSNNWTNRTTIDLASTYEPLSAGFGTFQNRDVLGIELVQDTLYYSFINGNNIYIGATSDGTTFTEENLSIIDGLNTKGRSLSLINKALSPILFYTDDSNLYVSSFNDRSVSLNAIVSGSEVEKAWKHAAIEPLFGPGIVYNTVKSGVAVDWPCLTGSVAYRQLSNGVVINPFYPTSKLMASFLGENGNYNMQGSLRSIINYRVPFENILYPKEIFAEKTEVTSNMVENYPVGESIPTNSQISQFIDGAYIYGGYEPYINPSDVGDIYGQTAKRFSVPFVYKKRNIKDDGLYTLAMNNFMAETVNFFLEEGKMVTFESKPDNEWPEFKMGKTYYMDVILEKSSDLVMMEAWHSDKHPIGANGEKMNGRYFGYPVNKTTKDLWEGEELNSEETRLMHNDPAYAPYTPPYFEGVARARLTFTPETSGKYTVTEVLENMVVEDIFIEAARGWEDGSDAQVHKMSVAQSVDISGFSKVVSSIVDTAAQSAGTLQVRNRRLQELPENKKWVISPRFETPVLDFSEQQFVKYENNYLKTSGYGRGMWSGYGKSPEGSKGIFLGLSYPFRFDFTGFNKSSNRRSLLDHVGFKAEKRKIGQIRSNGKTIKEAVVLVPYLESYLNSQYNSRKMKLGPDMYSIKIDRQQYNRQKRRIENAENATDTKESTSITRMIETMKNYVIPPELNFLDNENIKPFVMYFFEFEHQLSQQDLVDIWQGLMPDISYNAETEEVEISHPSAQDEFFHGNPIPEKLKWLVFRVKQKAVHDFGKITSSTKDDQRFAQNTVVGRQGIPYSYNWPYDYCSLVEFAKVELSLRYKKKEE